MAVRHRERKPPKAARGPTGTASWVLLRAIDLHGRGDGLGERDVVGL